LDSPHTLPQIGLAAAYKLDTIGSRLGRMFSARLTGGLWHI
jgi:hypothetical protein